MATSNHFPDFKILKYQLNNSGYYQMKEQPLFFIKMPYELKVEKTQRKDVIKSDYIIRSRRKNSKYYFFTGIIPTNFKGWYFGDYFERKNGIKKNSFILFQFSPDKMDLTVCFFNHFKLYPNKRKLFIDRFFKWFENKKGSDYPTPSYQII